MTWFSLPRRYGQSPAPVSPPVAATLADDVIDFTRQHLSVTLEPWQEAVLHKIYGTRPAPAG